MIAELPRQLKDYQACRPVLQCPLEITHIVQAYIVSITDALMKGRYSSASCHLTTDQFPNHNDRENRHNWLVDEEDSKAISVAFVAKAADPVGDGVDEVLEEVEHDFHVSAAVAGGDAVLAADLQHLVQIEARLHRLRQAAGERLVRQLEPVVVAGVAVITS